jgi:CRP/FNR family transcriptional regulator
MLNAAAFTPPAAPHAPMTSRMNAIKQRPAAVDPKAYDLASQQIATRLCLLRDKLTPQKRVVRAGDVVYQAGEQFTHLFIINSGIFKMINLSPDGREQVSGLKFRGDWLGFDGIADSQYGCDAVAMDTGEVWLVRYADLLASLSRHPALTPLLHEAMSREISRERDSLMSVCTLPADARVADFLRYWTDAQARRGLRMDQITLRMTRAEIGNYLGMTLETVSRSLSKLARANVIAFAEKGRREIRIPDLAALAAFVQDSVSPEPLSATLQ